MPCNPYEKTNYVGATCPVCRLTLFRRWKSTPKVNGTFIATSDAKPSGVPICDRSGDDSGNHTHSNRFRTRHRQCIAFENRCGAVFPCDCGGAGTGPFLSRAATAAPPRRQRPDRPADRLSRAIAADARTPPGRTRRGDQPLSRTASRQAARLCDGRPLRLINNQAPCRPCAGRSLRSARPICDRRE